MERKFKPLDDKFEHKDTIVSFFQSMFKLSEFIAEAQASLVNKGLEELNNKFNTYGKGKIPTLRNASDAWLKEGVPSEILIPGTKGWKTGKIRFRVTLEFCPDEPEIEEIPESNHAEINQAESPLDDIGPMINQDS